MSKYFGLFLLIIFGVCHSFSAPDYLEWSEKKPITFADFKASTPKGTKSPVNLKTLISYQFKQGKGNVPQVTITNYMDRSESWVKMKRQEILDLMQIRFDYSELYARKIRKQMIEMNKKKVKEKQKYLDEITRLNKVMQKQQAKASTLLADQPHLIKIMQKDVRDSIQIYKPYAQ